jgi:hypothetical protein
MTSSPPSRSSSSPADRHLKLTERTRAAFFAGEEIPTLSDRLSGFASAVHAYDVSTALTYVTGGNILPHYQK